MYTCNINLYEFDELTDKAQQKAIDEHRDFLLSMMEPNDFISGDPEYDTPEELQKVYEQEYDYYLFNDEPIVESIECNEYLFYADGKLANTTKYYGTHTKAGIVEFSFHGETIIIA